MTSEPYPTANSDSKAGHETTRLLRRIAKDQGRSVVIASRDQRIKDTADRVLWLEDGQFKNMVAMATDPVCGMAVEQESRASQSHTTTRRTTSARAAVAGSSSEHQRPLQAERDSRTSKARGGGRWT